MKGFTILFIYIHFIYMYYEKHISSFMKIVVEKKVNNN